MKLRGFTLVELLIIISVVAVISSIAIVGYTPFQKRSASAATQAALDQARSRLELYNGLERDYPPNLAGVDYTPPDDVVITLYTNAPQIRIHQNLTQDQNAQLLLNACNASMPIYSGGELQNTSCAFAGNNFHVKGQRTSNVVLLGPVIQESKFVLDCGAECNEAQALIKQQFIEQGGTWPVSIPKKQTTLPPPTLLESYGKATKYCLEGRFVRYNDVVFHMQSGSTQINEGICPSDPELHYP